MADQVGGPGLKKRHDPHQWETREAQLVLGERVLRRYDVYVCAACEIWTEERPALMRDLPLCKEPPASKADEIQGDN
jgi:hypothetical protein